MGAEKFDQLSLATTTKQSLLSLAFNFGGILAGLMVASYSGLFSFEPWIIALYPGILSMRGVIGGLFAGHLSTGLHLGVIPVSLFGENTKKFYLLWGSIVVLTFESSLLLGLVALLFGAVFWGISVSGALAIFGTIIAAMGLSLLVISPLTIALAFSSFKKGLDPDIIVYPIESTVADILITLCYISVLGMLFFMDVGWFILLLICIIFGGVVLTIFWKSRGDVEFSRTVKEALYTMVIVAFIVNITGSILSHIGEVVEHNPKIYVVYPALIDTMGDVGAIVGSTATTKLALGTIASSLKSIKNHRNQIAGAWIASIVISALFAPIVFLYKIPENLFSALRFTSLLLATNIFAAIFMICISFSVAILTFRKGLDPDNFVIPIESTLADTITTISLLTMISLIGGV
ncbi:MAG: magnesium transporter [Candidatus Bathyarchaeia archaeon]